MEEFKKIEKDDYKNKFGDNYIPISKFVDLYNKGYIDKITFEKAIHLKK